MQPFALFHHHAVSDGSNDGRWCPEMLAVAGGFIGSRILTALLTPGVERRAVVQDSVQEARSLIAVVALELYFGNIVQRDRGPHAVRHPARMHLEAAGAQMAVHVLERTGNQLMIGSE